MNIEERLKTEIVVEELAKKWWRHVGVGRRAKAVKD
jgi:hypothetical protein